MLESHRTHLHIYQAVWINVAVSWSHVNPCTLVATAFPQVFKGFTVRSRYLRLYLVDNHGGSYICFHGIQLHGADSLVLDCIADCGLARNRDSFISLVRIRLLFFPSSSLCSMPCVCGILLLIVALDLFLVSLFLSLSLSVSDTVCLSLMSQQLIKLVLCFKLLNFIKGGWVA